ncbi:hypothetical protein HK098_008263 [Nowakowskiella sp. JEL0407]|nr:hypothetical protein HK098_008263 [Nowakowskiella sp. JEL0407]
MDQFTKWMKTYSKPNVPESAANRDSVDLDGFNIGGNDAGNGIANSISETKDKKSVQDAEKLEAASHSQAENNLKDTVEVKEGSGSSADAKPEDPETLLKSESDPTEPEKHFTAHEFGNLPNMILYDSLTVVNRSTFFQPLLPRQFFIRNVLHREQQPRKITWDELFFDLIVVASLSRVATILKEPGPDGITAETCNRFSLVILPLINLWMDTTLFANRLGANSLSFRTFMWTMMLVMSSLGINSKSSFALTGPITANIFATTYIIGKTVSILGYSNVFFTTPKFRPQLYSATFPTYLSVVPLFISLFMSDRNVKMALWWTSLAIEFTANFIPYALNVLPSMRAKYRFALNIEHQTERMGLLTLVVLGEVVIGILWDSPNSELTSAYGATFLGLIIAISFQWIYFNVEGGHHFEHAIRRNVVTSLIWYHFHTPLHISLVSAGVGITKLIAKVAETYAETDSKSKSKKPPDHGLTVMFICSCGVALFALFIIGLMHKHHPNEQALISKEVRLGYRLVASLFLMIFGGLNTISDPILLIGIVTIVMFSVVGLEEVANLEKKSSDKDTDLDGSYTLYEAEAEIIEAHPVAALQIRRNAKNRGDK